MIRLGNTEVRNDILILNRHVRYTHSFHVCVCMFVCVCTFITARNQIVFEQWKVIGVHIILKTSITILHLTEINWFQIKLEDFIWLQ